ncbi:FAD/NAD(P)-binding domain-containing protein [Lindgomyces ingoldianus]|uniref:FAD/NAD(P)-binding domain-containing protein n=1 Tax=Lindgomyces ingoldianus TaxID=673940 RepID=A0ACB6QKT6_9PLEO|nr:FAD/NAD(P)-binding domain-containing protein [Lindgomyces ingoldianus]KAF2466732.1 FAD/NAD(P)-binding domain-containing protein [Lindgomyces ingoldianus]
MSAAESNPPFDSILIVGAGPSGLLLALLLARQLPKIEITLVDANDGLDTRPRATHYGPPAAYELRRAGIIEDVKSQGFIPKKVCWRKLDGTYLAGLDGSVMEGITEDRLVCLPLDRLGKILVDHLKSHPNVSIKWGHNVTGLGEDAERSKAWVDVDIKDQSSTRRFEADYVVGCDGANSQVRRTLFGDLNFPGRTWDEQVVATNVYYDFDKFGYEDSQFHIHPEHWYMAARITRDGMWRVSYGELVGLSPEELIARQPTKYEVMLPGHPKPHEYRITNIGPYKIHQRCAEKMRVGRFLLAADAAHLCNPFGGLGLTGGICDIGSLHDCLIAMYEGKADDSILDVYDEVRRQKWRELIDPISSDNIRRLFGQDPEVALENDEFLKMCKRTEIDIEFARQVQSGMDALRYDFTPHFKENVTRGPHVEQAVKGEAHIAVGAVSGVID